MKAIFRIGFALIVATAVLVAPATAAAGNNSTATPTPGPGEEDEDTVVNINLGEVIEAIQNLTTEFSDFTGSWKDGVIEVLFTVFFKPFNVLAQKLLEIVVLVLTTVPQVYPNPAVEEVHRQALLVAIGLTGAAFAGTGLLYIVGPLIGVSYREARLALPRLVVALIFSAISLPLLQLAIDGTNALTQAFAPNDLALSFTQMMGLSSALVLAVLADAILLLGVVAMFIIRDVYIMMVAAASPLLAVMWAFPKSRKYADPFIAGFFASLLIGPADVFVLRFALALMEGNGANILQTVSNWIFGFAALVLLILVPFQIWSTSQFAVSLTSSAVSGVRRRVSRTQRRRRRKRREEQRQQRRKESELSKDEEVILGSYRDWKKWVRSPMKKGEEQKSIDDFMEDSRSEPDSKDSEQGSLENLRDRMSSGGDEEDRGDGE